MNSSGGTHRKLWETPRVSFVLERGLQGEVAVLRCHARQNQPAGRRVWHFCPKTRRQRLPVNPRKHKTHHEP